MLLSTAAAPLRDTAVTWLQCSGSRGQPRIRAGWNVAGTRGCSCANDAAGGWSDKTRCTSHQLVQAQDALLIIGKLQHVRAAAPPWQASDEANCRELPL